jgi:hypothetical protein
MPPALPPGFRAGMIQLAERTGSRTMLIGGRLSPSRAVPFYFPPVHSGYVSPQSGHSLPRGLPHLGQYSRSLAGWR